MEPFEGNGGHLVPQVPKAPESQILSHFGLLLGALGELFWDHFGLKFRNWRDLCRLVGALFPVFETGAKRGLPRGGDMRSAHAGACFVRVGSCRLGSVLGSILGAFWEPRSPLYSLLVDLGCKLGAQK